MIRKLIVESISYWDFPCINDYDNGSSSSSDDNGDNGDSEYCCCANDDGSPMMDHR